MESIALQSAPSLAQKAPRPSLAMRTDEVNQLIEQLEAALIHLSDRLEPVLAPSTPMPDTGGAVPRADDDSWLSDYLGSTARRINELVRRTGRLIDRVDL